MEFICTITKLKIKIRHYWYKGTEWLVAYAPEVDQYVAIDYEYILENEDGKLELMKELNGLQMHLSPTKQAALESVNMEVDLQELLDFGYTRAQALCKLSGAEYRPELEALFS